MRIFVFEPNIYGIPGISLNKYLVTSLNRSRKLSPPGRLRPGVRVALADQALWAPDRRGHSSSRTRLGGFRATRKWVLRVRGEEHSHNDIVGF